MSEFGPSRQLPYAVVAFTIVTIVMTTASPSRGTIVTFNQNFESDLVGSAVGNGDPGSDVYAGWNGNQRFYTTSNNTVAVINTDSVSPSNSLKISGASGMTLNAWRNYGGLSSDGVQPVTVSFDFKISYTAATGSSTVEFDPFIYNNSKLGTNGTPGKDGDGAPVAVIVNNGTGTVSYNANGTLIPLLSGGSGYTQGDWAHFTATLKGYNDVDVAVTMLTGAHAGSTASIADAIFQYDPSSGPDVNYYANAMDELRGLGFVGSKLGTAEFTSSDYLMIDNLSVSIGVPEPSAAVCFGAAALMLGRRRKLRAA